MIKAYFKAFIIDFWALWCSGCKDYGTGDINKELKGLIGLDFIFKVELLGRAYFGSDRFLKLLDDDFANVSSLSFSNINVTLFFFQGLDSELAAGWRTGVGRDFDIAAGR